MDYSTKYSGLEQENKRLLELLKDSENQREKERFLLQKLDLFNQDMPMAVIDLDLNSCITDWNPSAETIFGYSKKEVLGKCVNELIVPLSAREQISKIQHLLFENKGGTRSTNENIRKDGELIVCEWYNIPIVNAEGEVTGISSLTVDVTEKTKRAKDLDESNARYKLLSEITYEGIIIHNNGIALDVNSSLEQLIQYRHDEIVGKDIIKHFIPLEYRSTVIRNIQNKFDQPYEIQVIRKNGELIWVEIQAKGMQFQGQEIRTVAVRDIEQRKRNEQKLRQALIAAQESDRLKSTFLSTISHELRTPLNAVIGFSDLIDENMEIKEAASLAKMIFKSGNHLIEIINDIFDLSAIEEGSMSIVKEEHLLISLMNEIKEHIDAEKIKMGKEALKLNFNLDASYKELKIYTDAKRFKQILFQLLSNALKYTKEGFVEVGYTRIAHAIKFYVKDTGIGILKENQKDIFNSFRQLDDKNTREYEGVGIGLSIAKRLCENLGGEISLISEKGQGSTFFFTIPYQDWIPKNKEYTPSIPVDLSILNGISILIAEKHPSTPELLEKYLKPYNGKVHWVKTGAEAIDVCSRNKQIDLFLIDIQLQTSSGYEATKELKAISPELPIIALTDYAINIEKELAINAGCNDYIPKPINWTILSERMAFHLHASKKTNQ